MSSLQLKINTTLTVIASTGSVISPNPDVFLLHSYEGQTFSYTGSNFFFTVSPLAAPYEFEPNTTSTSQTFTYKNEGTTVITISTITVSDNNVTPYLNLLAPYTSFPITLNTGTQGTFTLYYSAVEQGTYFNEVNLQIVDADDYVFSTEQRVDTSFSFDYDPIYVVNTLTNYGGYIDNEILFESNNNLFTIFTATIVGSSDYSIESISNDGSNASVLVRFNGFEYDLGTITTSTASLIVSVNSDNVEIPFTTTVSISTISNIEIGSWQSSIAYDNAFVGFSYDIINSIRYLTIGIGSGGDSSPEIVDNGFDYLKIIDLGIRGNNTELPFVFWREVYRIPITNQMQTFYSKDYLVKSINADDLTQSYGYYFGTGIGQGSIFVIESDDSNNIEVKINQIREYKNDISFDRTLENLQDIFYFYSSQDRIYNLELPINDTQTHYLIGFNNDGTLRTSIKDHP